MGDNGTDTAPDETGNTGDGQQPTSAEGNNSGAEADADQSDDPIIDGDSEANDNTDSEANDDTTTDDDNETSDGDEDEPTGETHTLTVNLVNYEDGSPREDGYIRINDDQTVDSDASGDPTQVTVDLEPGEYTITGGVRDEEYRWTTSVETVQLYEDATINLQFAEVTVYTVTVHAGTDDEPADNADITVRRKIDGATTTKTTGAEGEVTFNLYGGEYTFTGSDALGNEQTETTLISSKYQHIRFPALKPSDWTSTQSVEFIVNVNGNIPIEGMTVKGRKLPAEGDSIDIETEPTNANGRTSIHGEQGDAYQVWVTDAEDGTYYDPLSVSGGGDRPDPEDAFRIDGETIIHIQIPDTAAPPGSEA